MGCCCCCFPKTNENPRSREERVPLSHARPSSVVSTEMDDANVETIASVVYTSPPPPPPPPPPPLAPFVCPQRNVLRLPRSLSNNSDSAVSNDTCTTTISRGTEEKERVSKEQEMEMSKNVQETIEEDDDDVCPICLEEYEKENPRMVTGCDHHYHLACILEWMERSDLCPVCNKELVFDELYLID